MMIEGKLDWNDDHSYFWYVENGAMELHFYRPEYRLWTPNADILVYVDLSRFRYGSSDSVKVFILRGLIAGGIEHEDIANLRLDSWNTHERLYWRASLVPTQQKSNSLREG